MCFIQICMHQCGCISESGGNFLNLLQKEGYPEMGVHSKGGGGSNPGGNCAVYLYLTLLDNC